MRITEPYNGTIVADNYIKDYVYVIMKNNSDVNTILIKIFPLQILNNTCLKNTIKETFDKYCVEYKELMLEMSKQHIISDIKDRVLQKYMMLYYEQIRLDINRTIIA